jgi:hypothetical protein
MVRQLLANLFARGAALQGSFSQGTIDLLIPTYTGPIAAGTIFDPALLSAVVTQIKLETAGDTNTGNALRPIGVPRDIAQPLPYLVLLLELGNESLYQGTNSKIKTTASPAGNSDFQKLTENWLAAVADLDQYRCQAVIGNRRSEKKQIEEKTVKIVAEHSAMDQFNQYTIFVRGASPEVYGILKRADIGYEFQRLLGVTMRPPTAQDLRIQQMMPLQHLGLTSGHTAWMTHFVVRELRENKEDDHAEGSDVDIE